MINHIRRISKEQWRPKGTYVYRIRNVRTGAERVWQKDNLTPDVALIALAMQGKQDYTYNFLGNPYICLGTLGNTPLASDVQLGAEVQRKACSVVLRSLNELEFSAFWNVGEATGIWREQGLMADGAHTQATASLNSGILWSHVDETFEVAEDEETLGVSFYLTINRP